MIIKITSLKRKSKNLSNFRHREWKSVHPEHFGAKQDDNLWKKRKFIYKAGEGKEIVGVLQGDWVAGVMYVYQLIVKNDKHGQGIGKTIMEQTEKLAHENKLHKIYLKTGIDWKAVKFYESLGYKTEGILTNFYEHKDFRIMTKEI